MKEGPATPLVKKILAIGVSKGLSLPRTSPAPEVGSRTPKRVLSIDLANFAGARREVFKFPEEPSCSVQDYEKYVPRNR
jgi:hypothetical protein